MERGGFRGRLSAFLRRNVAGAEKKPRRERRGYVRPLPRARNHAREPRRRVTRAGGHRRARPIRAQKRVPPLEGAQAGGGADGMERNGTRRRGRYAGTEPQSFSDGMGNMTCHDTMQGSFHEPSRSARPSSPRPPPVPASERGSRGDGGRRAVLRRRRKMCGSGRLLPGTGALCRDRLQNMIHAHGDHDET